MSKLLGEIRRARRERRGLLRDRQDLCAEVVIAERELSAIWEYTSGIEYFGPTVRDQDAAIRARSRQIKDHKVCVAYQQKVLDARSALLAVEVVLKGSLIREVAALQRWAMGRRQHPGDDAERRALVYVYRACFQTKFHAPRILADLAWHDPDQPDAWRSAG